MFTRILFLLLVLATPVHASMSTTSLRDNYTAGGGATDFTFNFPIYTKQNIKVILNGTEQTLDTNYTVRSGSLPFESVWKSVV